MTIKKMLLNKCKLTITIILLAQLALPSALPLFSEINLDTINVQAQNTDPNCTLITIDARGVALINENDAYRTIVNSDVDEASTGVTVTTNATDLTVCNGHESNTNYSFQVPIGTQVTVATDESNQNYTFLQWMGTLPWNEIDNTLTPQIVSSLSNTDLNAYSFSTFHDNNVNVAFTNTVTFTANQNTQVLPLFAENSALSCVGIPLMPLSHNEANPQELNVDTNSLPSLIDSIDFQYQGENPCLRLEAENVNMPHVYPRNTQMQVVANDNATHSFFRWVNFPGEFTDLGAELSNYSSKTFDDAFFTELTLDLSINLAIQANTVDLTRTLHPIYMSNDTKPIMTFFPINGPHNTGFADRTEYPEEMFGEGYSEVDDTSYTCDMILSNSDCHAAATDIFGDIGTPIIAAQSGIIRFRPTYRAYDAKGVEIKTNEYERRGEVALRVMAGGNSAYIEDANGWTHYYTHMDAVCIDGAPVDLTDGSAPAWDDTPNAARILPPGGDVSRLRVLGDDGQNGLASYEGDCIGSVSDGGFVAAGTVIGFLGKDGTSWGTTPHVHYDIHKPYLGSRCTKMNSFAFLLDVEPNSCQVIDRTAPDGSIQNATLNGDNALSGGVPTMTKVVTLEEHLLTLDWDYTPGTHNNITNYRIIVELLNKNDNTWTYYQELSTLDTVVSTIDLLRELHRYTSYSGGTNSYSFRVNVTPENFGSKGSTTEWMLIEYDVRPDNPANLTTNLDRFEPQTEEVRFTWDNMAVQSDTFPVGYYDWLHYRVYLEVYNDASNEWINYLTDAGESLPYFIKLGENCSLPNEDNITGSCTLNQVYPQYNGLFRWSVIAVRNNYSVTGEAPNEIDDYGYFVVGEQICNAEGSINCAQLCSAVGDIPIAECDPSRQAYHNDFNNCTVNGGPCQLVLEGQAQPAQTGVNQTSDFVHGIGTPSAPPARNLFAKIIALITSIPDSTIVDKGLEVNTKTNNEAIVLESQEFINVAPGEQYTIQSRIKTADKPSRAEVFVTYYDENFTKLAKINTYAGSLKPNVNIREWQELSKNVTIPTRIQGKNVTYAKVIVSTSKNSVASYDDIHFAKNKTPNAVVTSSHDVAIGGDTILLDARESTDPENDPLSFDWFLINNGGITGITLTDTADSAVKSIQLPEDLTRIPNEGTHIKAGVFVSDGISKSVFETITIKIDPSNLNMFTVKYIDRANPNTVDFDTTPITYHTHEIPSLDNPKISHNWGTGSPHTSIGANRFAAQWKGKFSFDDGGNYTFVTKSDERVRMRIEIDAGGGNIISMPLINNWRNHLVTTDHSTVNIPPGKHTIVVEYYEHSGQAELEVSWGRPGEFECVNESAPSGTFCNAFYNNRTLSGLPVYMTTQDLTRTESPNIGVSKLWGTAAPAIDVLPNNFSAQWIGKFTFEEAPYIFTSHAGDGMKIFVDDELVVDNWRTRPNPLLKQVTKDMTAGEHIIRVEYYEASGDATAEFFWDRADEFECRIESAPSGTFCNAFYNNKTFTGLPVYMTTQDLTRTESPNLGVSNVWGTASPGNDVNPNLFSARWIGKFDFEGGDYLFTSHAGDGMRIFVDEELVVDNWGNKTNPKLEYGEVTLSPGEHIIRVDYYEHSGDATAEFFWDKAEVFKCSNSGAPSGKFCAAYYNNKTFTGLPTVLTTQELTRTESPNLGISNLWGTASPDPRIPVNSFSAEWRGKFMFENANYTFTSNSGDGMKIFVDDELVVDNWGIHGTRLRYNEKAMTEGEHIIRVVYYEHTGDATAEFFWDKTENISCVNEAAPNNKFCVSYYNNKTLTGLPVYRTDQELTRTESPNIGVSKLWGTSGPGNGVNTDYFSARWIGKFTFDEAPYIFTSHAGDGMKIFVDDELIVNNWNSARTNPALKYVEKEMTAGVHTIRVEYYEHLRDATAEFFWDRADALECHPSSVPQNKFCVEYYPNKTRTGLPRYINEVTPTVTENKTEIRNNWLFSSPDINQLPSDGFSVEWVGQFEFDYDVYTFTSESDDGMIIYLDNVPVVNNWGNHTLRTRTSEKLVSAGMHTVRVVYFDNVNSAIANFSWENDENDNTPPEITNYGEAPTSIREKTAYRFDVNAIDADNDKLVYTLVDGPTSLGMRMNAAGLITWKTPEVSSPKNYTTKVQVTDGKGGIAEYEWVISVEDTPNSPPVITNHGEAPTSIYENTLYHFNVDATDADGETLTYELVDGPTSLGMTINETNGVIRWNTPEVSSTRNYTTKVVVTDERGAQAEYEWVISIQNKVNADPVITNYGLAPTSIYENTIYSFNVNATDADGDTLTYTLTDGPTSSGMSINSATGLIRWATPSVSTSRTYVTEVTVTDGNGGSAVYQWVILVQNRPNRNPVITNHGSAPTSVQEGQLYVFDVNATDADGDTLTYTLTDGPTSLNMNINSSTGYITWIAPQVSSTRNYTTEVTVTDGNGGSASYQWVISVRNTPATVYPYGISSVRTVPSSFSGERNISELFDGLTAWPHTAIVYHNSGSLIIDLEFANTTTLRGLDAYIAGEYAGSARYKWTIQTAPNASSGFTTRTSNWITNNQGYVNVPIPSATGKVFRVIITRDNGDGVEHVLELRPRF